MAGETDLMKLLRGMEPVLWADPYGYAVLPAGHPVPDDVSPFALIDEAEGVTLVASVDALAAAGLAVGSHWARITLTIHSDLAAVGLTAAFAQALAARGISANVVAGFHHDHIFVQWDRRQDALDALRQLAQGAGDA